MMNADACRNPGRSARDKIENPLSEMIISGKIAEGDKVRLTAADGKLKIS